MNRTAELILDDSRAAWSTASSDSAAVHARGYAFVGDDFYEGRALADFIHRHCSEADGGFIEELRKLIPRLNGGWGLAVKLPDGRVLAAADRMRSVPLFYARRGETVAVASSAYSLIGRSTAIRTRSAAEYLLAGFVTGSNTLFEGVEQLQAGEILEVDSCGRPALNRYWRYLAEEQTTADEETLERRVDDVFNRLFARYARAFGGRRIIVPLSGGLDSRLIAGMLKRYGAENVLCFSYGLHTCGEVQTGRRIAESLGFQWRLIEYGPQVWLESLASLDASSFYDYCSNAVSLPHLQDLPAIQQLMKQENLRDAIIMPGHSFDMIAGSHIDPALLGIDGSAGMAPILEAILRIHYNFLANTARFAAQQQIPQWVEQQLGEYWQPDSRPAGVYYDAWEVDNRQAKFIVNSLRSYDFHGIPWAMPLWDYELIDLFAAIPPKYKIRQRVHFNALVSKTLRGDLDMLREIPRDNGQMLTERITGEQTLPPLFQERQLSALYRICRVPLKMTGLMQVLRRWYCGRLPDHPLAFDHWFTGGRDPRRITLGEVLDRRGAWDVLPEEARRMLRPHTRRLMAQTNHTSAQAVIELARHYRMLNHMRGKEGTV